MDWLNDQLSLEVWTKKAQRRDGFDTIESFKAEILVTCGGPTVKIELDSRWDHADLFHSWGCRNDEELTRWELSTKATSLLADMIGELEGLDA